MSGGRFLVNLTEVLWSESIISYKILLKHDIDYKPLTISSQEVEHQMENFMDNVNLENIDRFIISENTDQVVGYVSEYITHQFLLRTNCHKCIHLVQKDAVMNNEWTNALNRGGLKLPSKLLYEYFKTAFCILEFFEEKNLATKIPFKCISSYVLRVTHTSFVMTIIDLVEIK